MNHRFNAPADPRHDNTALRWIALPVLAWLLTALLVFWFSYSIRYADDAAAAEPSPEAVPATVFYGA